MALSFPEVTEEPHFGKSSFRIRKKIFLTCEEALKQACIKLSEAEQDLFCLADRSSIFPVPNAWGKQGWTYINLSKVSKVACLEALKASYNEVAPKKLRQITDADTD